MRNWIVRWIAGGLALYLVTQIVPGISLDKSQLAGLLVAMVALAFVNALIRPIIMFFVWPINCLTFGLLGFVINVLLFWLVGQFVPGFHVKTMVAALEGSILMGILSGLFNFLLKDRGDRDNR